MTRQLTITMTDEFDTFTNLLGGLTEKINDGYTSGFGWSIQEEYDQISDTWCIEDVKQLEEDHEIPEEDRLTDTECRQVLQAVEHHKDANIGINWENLEYWMDEVRSERKL